VYSSYTSAWIYWNVYKIQSVCDIFVVVNDNNKKKIRIPYYYTLPWVEKVGHTKVNLTISNEAICTDSVA